ncbi:MAG: hypothetical protein AAFR93_16015 [Pseudomonadota bacterium]
MLSRFATARAAAPYRPLDPSGERSDFLSELATTYRALTPLLDRNQLLALCPAEMEQLRKTAAKIGADARALGLQKLALRAYAFEFRIDDFQGLRARAHQSFEFRESFRYLLEVMGQTVAEVPNISDTPQVARKVVLASSRSLDARFAAEALGTGVELARTTSCGDLVAHLADSHADLILLGEKLSDLTVLETLDQLKETPLTARTPVLVLAEQAGTDISVGALVHGAIDVVPTGLPPSEAGQRMMDALTTGRQRLHRS